MSVRKKHHYIPRFYLKRFSINYDGKKIGLYNLRNDKFIQNAQIRHQACEEYLYGRDDEVEAELAKLESTVAKMFYYWTEEKLLYPPPPNTPAFAVLKRYILYQLFRTPKAGEHINKIADYAFKAMMRVYHPEELEKLKGGSLVHEDPVLVALLYSADQESLLDFMSCRFIVNLTPLPFITSDSPVVMYNQLMEKKGVYLGSTALAVKGLQIFFPIHPRLMICLYDTDTYSCGESENCTSTELVEDVHQLNVLQYLNSSSQIFFDEQITKEYVDHIVNKYRHLKPLAGPVGQLTKTKEGRYFYFSSSQDVPIGLNLSCINLVQNALDFETELAPLRHPSFERENDL